MEKTKTINKPDLVNILAASKKIRLWKKEWKVIVEELYQVLEKEVKAGNSVRIPKVGLIAVRKNNRKTVIFKRKKYQIKLGKTVSFKPVEGLKDHFKGQGELKNEQQ